MDGKGGHPADHRALLRLRVHDAGVDVGLLEELDRLLLRGPIQALVEAVPAEALVVAVKVHPLQHQAQAGGPGDVHLVGAPAALQHLLLGVALDHGDHQADHLADLVQHEALAAHRDHGELRFAAEERLLAGHLRDVAAGAGVLVAFLRGEVVEVVRAFVKGKERVDPVEGLWVQAESGRLLGVVVLWGKGHSWKHVGICTRITVVFGVEALGHSFKTYGKRKRQKNNLKSDIQYKYTFNRLSSTV